MSEFNNVTIVKSANIYYDGAVTSRTVIFDSGEKKTLGIMLPGDYEFGTSEHEIMEILSGELEIKLPGDEQWQRIKGPFTFEVPADSRFKLQIKTVTDYCCSYVPSK